ncbi:P110/LppT family adhesin N-terminal domain [Mycoplasma sp. 'Moose RK']|uniref:P110/LppT family adhesin N-terminal domain n=1 Tax=Mycoplasma sp. 'Moose RK' TaxID=2780095 RepID=UPI0018C28340|nr:P110/LppT family adhesin N-terminal domain [Mycoplasma sp. 'Moose RK']MBG0730662.1 P110/LppT family adhesin N-terminal domain [Mycoplasma sp. 'Moose RK']
MKKFTLKQILLTTLGVSAITSVAVTIPLVSSLTSRNFDQKLKEFVENKSSAKNLPKFDIENKQEIEELAKKLQPKSKFSERLDAYDALNLHYDKSYNFDINDAIDFSDLQKKFPNLTFKILAPESKNAVKISQNIIEDLPLSVTNPEKTVNFVTKINLDFSKKLKDFQFRPENLSATISLSKLDFLRNKTATEIAILFYKDFYKNYKESKDEKVAIFKTFSKFGGVSLSLSSDSLVILPSNYELKPDLQLEKLVFSNVKDSQKSISLSMILFDKLTNKSTNFSLKFVDLPSPNENFVNKFSEIFSQNFDFNSEISKYLAKNNLKPSQIIQKKSKDLNVESNFSSWFQAKFGKGETTFLNEIKPFLYDFTAKKVTFKLGEFEKNQTKNENLIPINLEISGNFSKSLNIPAGLNLNSGSEYTYNFSLNFDATASIYSSYLKNAAENFGSVAAKNPEKLNFELKKDLPITIFASTIDDTIKQFFNKPLDLKNITKTAAPLFELLNFSTKSKEKLAVVVPESEANESKDAAATEPKPMKVSHVSTTLFDEESVKATSPKNPASPIVPVPQPQQKLGDYLKSFFEDLAKSKFLPNTFVYLSSSFKDQYTLQIELRENESIIQKFEVKIDDVLPDNVAYKELTDNTKTYLFLDWQTNVKTEVLENEKTKKVTSISSINNKDLKFVPGKREEKNWTLPETKPYINEKDGGIYLTDSGLDLEKTTKNSPSSATQSSTSSPKTNPTADDLKLKLGKTFVYVFKPTKPVGPIYAKYFLLKTTTETNKNNFGLLIRPYNTIFPNILSTNLIGYESEKKPLSQGRFPDLTDYEQISSNGGTTFVMKTTLQNTYNGKADIKLKIDKNKNPLLDVNLKTKNSVDPRKDFLSQPNATVMLVLTIDKNDEGKNKQKLKFSLYTSEHKNGLEPIFNWDQDIEFGLQVDLSKNLTLGTTKTLGEKWPPEYQSSGKTSKPATPVNPDLAPKGGITFKALALFDKPKTHEGLTEILRKFHQQYFEKTDN